MTEAHFSINIDQIAPKICAFKGYKSLKEEMGVEIKVLKSGDGCTYPKVGQSVSIHYTGKLPDGRVFDSSRERDVPFRFKIGHGEVIRGWDEGIRRMSVGERSMMTCSPDYGYGKRGYPGAYPLLNELNLFLKLFTQSRT